MGKKIIDVPTVSQEIKPFESSATELISQAIDKNVPVETMERLLAMRRELKAEWAKEEFDKALSRLQGELPVIKKEKIVKGKDGKERYRYATIDSIVDQTRTVVSKNGFSYAITTEQAEVIGEVKAICTIKHDKGHSEYSTFRVPIDKESYMTAPQKVAAALTFAKRYAFCNAFGIITGDQDNDANEEAEEKTLPPVKKAEVPKPVKPEVDHRLEVAALLKTMKVEKSAGTEWLSKSLNREIKDITDLTQQEAIAMVTHLKGRLAKIKEAPDANLVDPSKNIKEKKTVDMTSLFSRAINCTSQEEATDIVGESVLDKTITESKLQAIKNTLTAKGFKV